MTPTEAQELDRLQKNITVLQAWLDSKMKGVDVQVQARGKEYSQEDMWGQPTNTPAWSFYATDYRLFYPKPIEKRVPKKGDIILVGNMEVWSPRFFIRFGDHNDVFASLYLDMTNGIYWNNWKFPDDPDPVEDSKSWPLADIADERYIAKAVASPASLEERVARLETAMTVVAMRCKVIW